MEKVFLLVGLWSLVFGLWSFAFELPSFYGEEVVVTATRVPQFKSELPVSTTIITKQDINILGADNLGEVLNFTFGTYSKTTGFLGSQVSGSIRGSSSQQMLILVNGQRLNSPLLGGCDLGDILVDNIEKVEIVRGPASALYGADALGGVVNIITRREEKILEIYPQLSERSMNTIRILTAGREKQTDYLFSISQINSPGYRPNSDYSSLNYSGKLGWYPARNLKMNCEFDVYNAKKGVPGSLTYPSLTTRQEDNNQRLRILSEAKLNSWSDLHFNLSFNQMEQLFNANPCTRPYDKYKSNSFQIETQNELELGKDNQMVLGAEYRNDQSQSSIAGRHLVTNKAVFIEDQHSFNDIFFMLGSGRFDSHSVYGDTFCPRAGLVYKFGKVSSIRFSYGEGYRAPTLNELYTYYVDPDWGMISRGNPAVKPEKSKNTEIGLASQIGKTEITINYFSSKVENLINWVDISGIWATWEVQNVAAADILGYELGITQYFLDNLKGFINYTNLKANDNSTGKDLTYRPRVQCNLGIEYNDLENTVGVLGRYVGDRYDDVNNVRKVEAYTVADVKYSKKINPDLIFIFGAENFLNTNYQDTYDYPMPGRRFTFGIKYTLI